jgi:ABC-type phosphate transport system substrate-binding protein
MTQHVMLYSDINYAVIVNPQNPVATLSDKQLRKIFSGSYDNWDEVNGPSMPLTIAWGDRSTGAAWVIADRIMDGEPVLGKSTGASDTSDIVAKVASTPNAVAIVPKSAVNDSVKTIQTSALKIKGPIILVSVGFPQKPLFKLINFLKENGFKNIGF